MTVGRKDDAGKPDLSGGHFTLTAEVEHAPLAPRVDVRREDHLPPRAALATARVMAYGARKYGDANYLDVPGVRRRYYLALLRHLAAWARGVKRDPDTGESHLAHVAACALILLEVD